MQANPQARQAVRTRDGIARRGARHHQACRGEDAVPVRDLDGFVYFRRQSKIVRRDNELFQCAASRRSRRKLKNSTPSRSRRFIMSGLRIISPRMAAILGRRK